MGNDLAESGIKTAYFRVGCSLLAHVDQKEIAGTKREAAPFGRGHGSGPLGLVARQQRQPSTVGHRNVDRTDIGNNLVFKKTPALPECIDLGSGLGDTTARCTLLQRQGKGQPDLALSTAA